VTLVVDREIMAGRDWVRLVSVMSLGTAVVDLDEDDKAALGAAGEGKGEGPRCWTATRSSSSESMVENDERDQASDEINEGSGRERGMKEGREGRVG
jgi:hypothetical protein